MTISVSEASSSFLRVSGEVETSRKLVKMFDVTTFIIVVINTLILNLINKMNLRMDIAYIGEYEKIFKEILM